MVFCTAAAAVVFSATLMAVVPTAPPENEMFFSAEVPIVVVSSE